ncbi:MAG TPA: hypothetical protein VJQ47_10965 [Steroidobacteraceae bacterium]|nr:hypothetical protein [Steroidobacteraceae bacterium]
MSLLVLIPLHLGRHAIVEPLIPVYIGTIRLLSPEFTVQSVDVAPEGAAETLGVRTNLSVPLLYAGRTLLPFGWNGSPGGGIEVGLSLEGLLEYPAMLFIAVLAWPASTRREFALRIGLAIPAAALLLLEAPLTVVAELWAILRDDYDPQGYCGWMIFSRFLMGGGGLALAIVLAGLIVAAARWILRPIRRAPRPQRDFSRDHVGNARLFLKPPSQRAVRLSAEEKWSHGDRTPSSNPQ